jgi:processive 1,2-diacylglycerol beta-glucosyltransferase
VGKKILLMYITEHSGHHQASIALEKAILAKSPSCSVLNIDAFKYTNPIIEKIMHKTYMQVIKKKPEIWNYLYDNPVVVKKTERIRKLANNAGSKKIDKLIKRFDPAAVACTQALPCGIVANYKKIYRADIPLVGALTDYAPHSYWIHDGVDAYIVPSHGVKRAFIKKGVPPKKIKVLGTPIDPLFAKKINKNKILKKTGLSPEMPVILIMGGTYGIGPDEKLISELGASDKDFQIIVVTGVNKKLYKKLKRMEISFSKKLAVMGFADNVCELMEIADIIITKPGGLTTAEAIAKRLPMIILNPLPGQESLNTKILTDKGIAVKARDERDAVRLSEELIDNPKIIKKMQRIMGQNGKPNSASDAAELLLKMAS